MSQCDRLPGSWLGKEVDRSTPLPAELGVDSRRTQIRQDSSKFQVSERIPIDRGSRVTFTRRCKGLQSKWLRTAITTFAVRPRHLVVFHGYLI